MLQACVNPITFMEESSHVMYEKCEANTVMTNRSRDGEICKFWNGTR